MSTDTTTPATLIEADPDVPTVRMVREFDAPRELVFRAHVEPELVRQWMGPDSIGMDIDVWDIRTGGEYRYTATREGAAVAHFYGAVHRVNQDEKIVQTFGFEEMPDAVSLDTLVFVELPGGRTRLEALSVVYDFESRAGMLASGMEVGVNEGYAALDRLLAELAEAAGVTPADEHRAVAGTFGDRVRGVGAGDHRGWDAATPVPDWRARDVVRHLVEWFPSFLADGTDLRLPPGPAVDDDPVGAWEHHAAAVQAVLDDPANDEVTFAHPRLPQMPLPQAIAQFYTNDVFMHTWDLARATGQDDRLDEERCRAMFTGMEPMDEMLRQSGQYGPRVPVADDASWQDRLVGFIGRDPQWSA